MGSCGGEYEEFCGLRYDSVKSGRCLPIFRKRFLPLPKGRRVHFCSLMIEAARDSETSADYYDSIGRHILHDSYNGEVVLVIKQISRHEYIRCVEV